MLIRRITPDDLEPARQLLLQAGWTKKVATPEVFAKIITASQIAFIAEDDGQVVGFLRAITDELFNGYISMVAVSEHRRGQGIGTALVNEVLALNSNITWVLRADRPGVEKFYLSLGFEMSSVAMEKKRQ
jgi:ribosomal protein S18 acetylase RimI-like enzyme